MPDQEPQAHSELASFGEELRREREIRGISLKEIADATKISKRFLEAIERNDHRTLPAPVFTRGFVREYARYLGLNADDMVNRYNYAAAGDDRIEKTPHLERLVELHTPQQDKQRPKKGIPPPYARVDRNVVILVVIVVALGAVFYWALMHRHMTRSDTEVAAVAPPRPVITQPKPVETPAASQPNEPLKMTVEVQDDSWVILEADGKTVINERMRRGDRREVEAQDSFKFRTVGNAGGVRLTLNDVKLPPLGRDGQVVHDRVVDHQTLEQARTTT